MDKIVIPNGLNPENYKFVDRKPGYNLAFMGDIGHKKGNMLLMQLIAALVKINPAYTLEMAGEVKEQRFNLYIEHFIIENSLGNNVKYVGFVKNKEHFFKDKNYIVCTSPWEGNNVSIMEGMLAGLKPVVHNFPGAKNTIPDRFVWNTIEEAIAIIQSENYCSVEYRDLIATTNHIDKQVAEIGNVLDSLSKDIYV